METLLLEGTALWCFKYEVIVRNRNRDAGFHITGVKPFHEHNTDIALTGRAVELSGQEYYSVPQGVITQLYIGFDEYYTRSLVKNFGLNTEPLRITTRYGRVLYFYIDYNFFGSANKLWFRQIKDLVS